MYDGVIHTCRFLDSEHLKEKFAHKLLTASKVKLKTYMGEDYLMF